MSCVFLACVPQAYIEDLNKRLDTLSGVRANSGRSLEDDLSHSYQLLSETEGQLVNLQTDLAYKTRDGDILRSQLETERCACHKMCRAGILVQYSETCSSRETI